MKERGITFQCEESSWSVRISKRSDGTGRVGLYWRDKEEPTHEADLDEDDVKDLQRTIR